MTITCFSCGGSCTGEVLKVQERHFHIDCFTCKVCHCLLASGGYFMKGNDYFCSKDYHVLFGTKCKTCGEYVEGRVVTALGHSYHPHCFACDRCKEEIRSGTVVTYNDCQEILCQKCTDIALSDNTAVVENRKDSLSRYSQNSDQGEMAHEENIQSDSFPGPSSFHSDQSNDLFDFSKVPDIDAVTRARMGKCSGCGEPIRSCQSLIALDRHWHLFCFTCHHCKKLLTSEYMSKVDKPYCEPCYHDQYGVMCEICREYITGKVLEAGEKHFHPTCAACCKCGHVFGEGEDMCIAGEDIWHLDCDKSKAAAGIHTDSEITSSDGSQSRSRTHSGTTPSPIEQDAGNQKPSSQPNSRSSSKLQMSRESSAGEPESKVIYPLKELKVFGNLRLPKGVSRTRLEQHLSDEDFQKAFRMDRAAFYNLQKWKQIDLKKRASLF